LTNPPFIQKRISPYLNQRWLAVYGYLAFLIGATPYLPLLIDWARRIWPSGSVSGFVLSVEIVLGAVLVLAGGVIRLKKSPKFRRYILAAAGFLAFSVLFYFLVPNPYELTHIPEYAVLSFLLVNALNPPAYVYSAAITMMIGGLDELYQGILPMRYFTWYDIMLNSIGGILGLTLFWAFSRREDREKNEAGNRRIGESGRRDKGERR